MVNNKNTTESQQAIATLTNEVRTLREENAGLSNKLLDAENKIIDLNERYEKLVTGYNLIFKREREFLRKNQTLRDITVAIINTISNSESDNAN